MLGLKIVCEEEEEGGGGGGGNAQICNHKAGARTVSSALQRAAELQRQLDINDTDLHKMAKWLP